MCSASPSEIFEIYLLPFARVPAAVAGSEASDSCLCRLALASPAHLILFPPSLPLSTVANRLAQNSVLKMKTLCLTVLPFCECGSM